MRRRWVVRPRPGEIEVHREDMAAALLDAEAMIARAGGHLSVVTDRVKTEDVWADGIEHEAITVAAVFEWKDRTDARPQAEATVQVAPVPVPPSEPVVFDHDDAPVGDDGIPDGLVAQEEPDVSSVPAGAR